MRSGSRPSSSAAHSWRPWSGPRRRASRSSRLDPGLVRMYSMSSRILGEVGSRRDGGARAMSRSDATAPKGRGAGFNPSNRFESTHYERELEQVEEDEEYLDALSRPRTEYLP